MSKLFNFIKEKFFTRSFITFCIIGFLNTLINFFVMKLSLLVFDLSAGTDISTKEAGIIYYISMGTSTLIAFICASLFSYFANARFTYKQNKLDSKTFFQSFFAFITRFFVTYLFTLLIWWFILIIFNLDGDTTGWLRTTANLVASILMIPPFYLVLGLIFKKTKERMENKEKEEKILK